MAKGRIIVVEDEVIVASDIEESLTNLGYTVVANARSGEEAITQARDKKPDLVLMDIKLKGRMDGVAAAKVIGEELGIPLVFLTAHADDNTLSRAKEVGPSGYILKPFQEIDLRITLEMALHRHRQETSSAIQKTESLGTHSPAAGLCPSVLGEPDPNPVAVATKPSFLKTIEPFSGLGDELLQICAEQSRLESFSSGDLIVLESDKKVDGFIVLSGRVSLLKTSSSGRQLIVELLPPGDIFAMIFGLDRDSFPLTARAQTVSQIVRFPGKVFLSLLSQYQQVYQPLTTLLAKRLGRSYALSRALAHDRVEVRIATTLLALILSFAALDHKKGWHKIPITRQELADLTGTSVETAIRVTKQMERDSLLELSETGIVKIVSPEGLRQASDKY